MEENPKGKGVIGMAKDKVKKPHKTNKCRICGGPIDREVDEWVMPSRNYYYHTKCYTDWKNNDSTDDEETWKGRIYDFIARDLKGTYEYHKCEAQRKRYIEKEKYTNKGIYFALKYFYEIEANPWENGHGGIGIVPYVYAKSTKYWTQREQNQRGTIEAIERQLREREARPVKVITKKKIDKNKAKWSLDDI